MCRDGGVGGRDVSEGKGPQRRLGRRLEEVAEAVGGGCCRLQMLLSLALGVRETTAGRTLGALGGGRGCPPPPPSNASLVGGSMKGAPNTWAGQQDLGPVLSAEGEGPKGCECQHPSRGRFPAVCPVSRILGGGSRVTGWVVGR